MLDAVKVSDLEEVSDQDTDSNVLECEEKKFLCAVLQKCIWLKVFSNLLVNGE